MPPLDERRYQVFVSSTFSDLQEERRQALEAILEMHCFPAGMELFPAADNEQWEFIKNEIDSSDYYVVILAGKYGSIAQDGISFTEKEYDYAVSIRKPVMGFLFHDLAQLKGSQLEFDPARHTQLEAFHAKAKRGKLVKFYKSPADLKTQIWQGVTHAIQFHPSEGWVRGRNSRRLEDLEELNSLRKQTAKLEKDLADLAKFSGGAESMLAQGSDLIEWTVNMRQKPVGNKPTAGQPIAVTISTTWNEIFKRLFQAGTTTVVQQALERAFEQLCAEHAVDLGLFDDTRKASLEIVGTEGKDTLQLLTIQLGGLDYIDVANEENEYVWKLTAKGKLQLALLAGRKRSSLEC